MYLGRKTESSINIQWCQRREVANLYFGDSQMRKYYTVSYKTNLLRCRLYLSHFLVIEMVDINITYSHIGKSYYNIILVFPQILAYPSE